MNNEVKELIDKVYDEGVRGASQPREVIIRLLELDPSSEEVSYLKEKAAELAHIATGACRGGRDLLQGGDHRARARLC